MKTLLITLDLNFNTLENSIKTVGLVIILIVGAALIINMIINPVPFVL